MRYRPIQCSESRLIPHAWLESRPSRSQLIQHMVGLCSADRRECLRRMTWIGIYPHREHAWPGDRVRVICDQDGFAGREGTVTHLGKADVARVTFEPAGIRILPIRWLEVIS